MLRRSAWLVLLVGLCGAALSPLSAGAALVGAADEPSVFVCYSTQSDPAVMPLSVAVALGETPATNEVAGRLGAYWQPFAVDPTVPGELRSATRLGDFWLTCNPFPLWPTGAAVGGSGELYDAAAANAYRNAGVEALGVYPVAGWTVPRIGPCSVCISSAAASDHFGRGERLSLLSWRAVRRRTSVTETVRFALCSTRSRGPFTVSVYEAYGPVSLAKSVDRTVQFRLRARSTGSQRTLCRNVRYQWLRTPPLRGHGDRELLVTVTYPLNAPAPFSPTDGRPFRLAAETTVRT